MRASFVRRMVAGCVVVVTVVGVVPSVEAFKPYTHVFAGDNAFADAVDDGAVTINGQSYPINARLLQALQAKPSFYDAGVIGPDGYPDTIMGQAIIHPENTGKWLRHTLDLAWAAQTDGRYSEDQKLEILAFSYGFLTHAAGDMWAHTIVNDFAKGVFPAVGEILGDAEAAAIAVRHIILEGYIGDATPGFDGNPDRTLVNGETNEDGDPEVSDDRTPGIDYGIPPDLFLWEAFVGRAPDGSGALTQPLPGQPTAERGPLLEFFFDLRNDLAEDAGSNSNIQEAVDNFTELQDDIDYAIEQCSFPPDLIECPIALGILGFETLGALTSAVEDLLEAGIEVIVDAYLAAWVDDIDDGLQHWSNVGNAFTEGLFDPRRRRDFQNEECGETGSGELSAARAICEDGVGLVSTFLDTLGESITTAEPNLLSMLGAPDFVAAGIELVDEVFDSIDALVDVPLPLENELAEFEEYIKELLLDAISEAIGFDIEAFAEVLKNPSSYMDEIVLPDPLDDIVGGVRLFGEGEHARLDTIIGFDDPGLTAQHHDLSTRRLLDDAELIVSEFEPLANTITTAKLLLLDGDQLDAVLSDILGRTMDTYPGGVNTNVMINALDGGDPWLLNIDSDHAWRRDGLPRFCDNTPGELCPPGATPRDPVLNGGRGQMPIWESCVARTAFAVLYDDWENGGAEFPALGDGVGPDTGSDPDPPTSSLVLDPGSAVYHDTLNNRVFVGGDNLFSVSAVDTPVGRAFPTEQLTVRHRITDPNGVESAWIEGVPGDTFSLTGPDGRYVLETQAADPCHTFDEADVLPASAIQATEYWLDTTAPITTCDNPPFGATFDTDDVSTVDYEVSDGPIGSGVAAVSSVIDGFETSPTATTAIADGDPIDMYRLYPGTRTVTVTATDNIGNTGGTGCTFSLVATAASLLSNLERARAEGDVPNNGAYNGLRAKLNQALKKHDAGQHPVEWNVLDAFINQIEGKIGGGGPPTSELDPVVGRRFIAYAQDIIDRRA